MIPGDRQRRTQAIAPPALRLGPGYLDRYRGGFRTTISILAGLLVWEAVGRFLVTDRLFLVPFTTVLAALGRMIHDGHLERDLYVSGIEFGVGFALASAVGIVLGILMGSSRWLRDYLDPWVSILYATPLVALTPFFILILGIGWVSKAALVFTLSVFPVLINTATGVRSVDEHHLEVAHSFNASPRQIFVKVLVPSSLPFIISGLRLASGRALIAVVVGELLFSSAGVGHLLSLATQTFNTGQLFAGVLIFACAGIVITGLLKRLEAGTAPWRAAP
jgi:NitT/TauT family transport system permease protein